MKKISGKTIIFIASLFLMALCFSQYLPISQGLMVAAAPVPNLLPEILQSKRITNPEDNPEDKLAIFADKSEQTLTIMLDGQPLKKYHADFGNGGIGDKKVAGDHKTPEGTFYISEKLVLSPTDPYLGTRWMRLSYPNPEDGSRGLQNGIIDKTTYQKIISTFNERKTTPQRTALGGGVGIHGGSIPELGSNWTWGCIGLSNKDIEEFYDYISVGTPVTIQR